MAVDLRGAGEKWALGSITFRFHVQRRHVGILDARMVGPARLAQIAHPGAEDSDKHQACCHAHRSRTSRRCSSSSTPAFGDQKRQSGRADHHVRVHPVPLRANGTGVHEPETQSRAPKKQNPSRGRKPTSRAHQSAQHREQHQGRHDAGRQVQQHDHGIEHVLLRECVQIDRGRRQKSD